MSNINALLVSANLIELHITDNGYVVVHNSKTYVTASIDTAKAFIAREFNKAREMAEAALLDNAHRSDL